MGSKKQSFKIQILLYLIVAGDHANYFCTVNYIYNLLWEVIEVRSTIHNDKYVYKSVFLSKSDIIFSKSGSLFLSIIMYSFLTDSPFN